MGIRKKFHDLIEKLNHSDKERMNEMLKPIFLEANEENLTSKIAFPYQEWACNQRGEIHGGGIAAMFDYAIGVTCWTFLGEKDVATTDMHVTYIRPFTGEKYIFETQINNLGRMMVRASCTARDSVTGKVLATAMATFIPVKTK